MAPCPHLPDSWEKAGARGDQRTVSVSWVSFVRPAERNPELQAGVRPAHTAPALVPISPGEKWYQKPASAGQGPAGTEEAGPRV